MSNTKKELKYIFRHTSEAQESLSNTHNRIKGIHGGTSSSPESLNILQGHHPDTNFPKIGQTHRKNRPDRDKFIMTYTNVCLYWLVISLVAKIGIGCNKKRYTLITFLTDKRINRRNHYHYALIVLLKKNQNQKNSQKQL